jgi:hypothetical protein
MDAEVWKEIHGILTVLGPPIITVAGVWLG